MTSQIEETLASLTALSARSIVQIDGFFKSQDKEFEGFRSTTFAAIKHIFRKIESESKASHSPVKSLRKQPRRKLKKSTRAKKTKPKKSHAQPPTSIDINSDNRIAPQTFSSRLQQGVLKGVQIETESEIPDNIPPPKSSGTNDDNSEKRTSAVRKVSPKRSTRSTASFRSAVGSPIQDGPKVETADDRQYNEYPSQDVTHSPEISESQWEDCRTKPEPTFPLHKAINDGLVPDGDGLIGEDPLTVAPSLGKPVAPENEASLKVLSPDKDRADASKGYPQPSVTAQTDHGITYETNNSREESLNGHTSDLEQLDESENEGKEGTPLPIHRRKQEAGSVATGGEVAQEIHDVNETDKKSSADPSLTDIEKTRRTSREKTNHQDSTVLPEISATEGSGIREHIKNNPESEAKALQCDHTRYNDFKFKAPKPKPVSNIPTPHARQEGLEIDAPRRSDVHQAPNPEMQKSKQSDTSQQNRVFQKHFTVDEGGKINDTGIGLLSEIIATPSRGNETVSLKNGEERTLRGTKLFKPTTDIYSAQRKPVLSRTLSVQKSNISSRASLLSHTPGAHAPTTRMAKHTMLTEPSSNSLRESLAALKQPITDSKPTQQQRDEKSSNEAVLNGPANLSSCSDEQGTLIPRGGKSLTFADEYKQVRSTPTQSARALESQASPAKGIRHPRVRGEAEKSALRRRIEEIRGKASAPIFREPISTRSSSDENLLGNSSIDNLDSAKSNVKQADSGILQTLQPRKQSHIGAVERKVVCIEREASSGDIGSVLPTASERQDGAAHERVFAKNHEREHAFSKQPTKKDSGCQEGPSGTVTSGRVATQDDEKDEIGKALEVETDEGETRGPKKLLSNLMCSVSSLYPSSLLGVRTNEERREETDGEVAAKRQRLDVERREAERLARMEAQRAARQKEAEEKQRRAEARRQLLAEAEKAKEDGRKRKEEHRRKVKQQEEEQRKRRKLEEDKKKEERRKQVLEKKAMYMEVESKRKAVEGKRQRHVKGLDRSMTGIPKPGGLGGGKTGKAGAVTKGIGKQTDMCQDGKDGGETTGTNSYVMTPAKATVIEESDEETERRRTKVIPQWAGERNLAISTRSQPDPDKVFVNMPMCNLREVFGSAKQYRSRSSSANWTQDRVTTSEMTKYKKAVGGFRDV